MARLQTPYAELQQRQTLAAFELADGELADVLAAMRADVQSDETPVARRALSLFVRRVDVDADRLVIWYHEPDLVECTRLQTVPPRRFEPPGCGSIFRASDSDDPICGHLRHLRLGGFANAWTPQIHADYMTRGNSNGAAAGCATARRFAAAAYGKTPYHTRTLGFPDRWAEELSGLGVYYTCP